MGTPAPAGLPPPARTEPERLYGEGDLPLAFTQEDFLVFYLVVYCCQFDDSRVVSGSADSSVKIWSTLSGRCLKTLPCFGEVVSSLSHF